MGREAEGANETGSKSRANPAGKRVAAGMPKLLQERLERLRELLATAESRDVLARYDVGEVIHAVKLDPQKQYGAGAVELLGRELSIPAKTLYRYAGVAAAWTRPQVKKLVTRKSARQKQPLSWSHLVALAQVKNPLERSALVDKILAEDLSVRDLNKVTAGEATASKTAPPRLPSILDDLGGKIDGLLRTEAYFATGIKQALERSPSIDEDSAHAITQAREDLDKLTVWVTNMRGLLPAAGNGDGARPTKRSARK